MRPRKIYVGIARYPTCIPQCIPQPSLKHPTGIPQCNPHLSRIIPSTFQVNSLLWRNIKDISPLKCRQTSFHCYWTQYMSLLHEYFDIGATNMLVDIIVALAATGEETSKAPRGRAISTLPESVFFTSGLLTPLNC